MYVFSAPSVENVQLAIHHIYPLVLPFKKILTEEELAQRGKHAKSSHKQQRRRGGKNAEDDDEELEEGEVLWDDSEEEEEDIEEDMYSGSDDSDL